MTELDGTIPRNQSHVAWGAVLAGAALATAVGVILLTFGGALGFSVTSPYEGEGLSPLAFVIAAGLWLLWIQVLSFYIGGYVAARLRIRSDAGDHETDVRDGLHGLLVWAVGVIAAALITFVGIGGVTTAARTAHAANDVVASVSTVVSQQVAHSAAQEATQGPPEASNATDDQRRAEVARKLSVLSAFITAASLLVGAVAAFFGAASGGHHRDKNIVIPMFQLNTRPTATTTRP